MASKVAKRKTRKKPRKNTWKENEVFLFATVLSSLEGRDKPWALILETLALKKTANESIFREILEEFDDLLAKEGKDENYRFNVAQLRVKYKWFKKEWRRINAQIKTGRGLEEKDTEAPSWYDLLDPLFSESVDDMLSVSGKASDLHGSDQDSSDDSSIDEECQSIASGHSNSGSVDNLTLRKPSLTPVPTPDDGDLVEEGGSVDKGDNDNECLPPKRKVKKETVVKVASKNKKQPKTQTVAMWQMVQSIERCSTQQEKKNSDERLDALLEAERKRDEIFLNFQREQAEANRRHELQIAQLLMSAAGQSPPSIASTSAFGTYPPVPGQRPQAWYDEANGAEQPSANNMPFYHLM